MPLDRQLFTRSLGEALADVARRKWPRDTAKHIEREWGVDRSTASNVVKGHASERTVSKAVQSSGWPLLMVLGEALTGETYEQHLQQEIEEAARVQTRLEERRARVADMAARARAQDEARYG